MDMGIGELAQITGVKIPTIRYYEQIGLLTDGLRSKGNQRRYGHGVIHRLCFIRCARDLGFGIDAIRDWFRLADVSCLSTSDALRIAKEQLVIVEEKITQLELLDKLIRTIAKGEHRRSSTSDGGQTTEPD